MNSFYECQNQGWFNDAFPQLFKKRINLLKGKKTIQNNRKIVNSKTLFEMIEFTLLIFQH